MEILFISFLSMKNRGKEAVSPKLNIKKVNSKLPDRLIQIFRSNSKVSKPVKKKAPTTQGALPKSGSKVKLT